MINIARNGGSITPTYNKILKQHAHNDRVSVHPYTTITDYKYCPATQSWELRTDPPIADLPLVDYVYFATGTRTDVNEMPLLKKIRQTYPIETRGGLPCLTDDLMWRDDVPLFVTGRLAQLRLGPGGPNLEGARLGAERIAWGLDDVLGGLRRENAHSQQDNEAHLSIRSKECFCGLGNRYAELGVEEEENLQISH